MGDHELHGQVVRGVASLGHLWVAVAGVQVSYHCGEVIEAGITGVPVVGLVAGEVEAAELGVGELAGLLRCPRRGQFGGEGDDEDPGVAFDADGPIAHANGPFGVQGGGDLFGEVEKLALGEQGQSPPTVLELTDLPDERTVDPVDCVSEVAGSAAMSSAMRARGTPASARVLIRTRSTTAWAP
jgi:hypothetical protein